MLGAGHRLLLLSISADRGMSDPAAAAPKARRAATNRTDRILSASAPLRISSAIGSIGALNVCERGLDHQLSARSFDRVLRVSERAAACKS